MALNQQTLRDFLDRRHPQYADMLEHWNFVEATYAGGRAWFEDNIFRYLKEGDKEFKARITRSYRFNHTREAVDLINKYIFKSPVERNEGDAPEEVKKFWKRATLGGLDIDQFMAIVSNRASIFGRCWVIIDTNKTGVVQTRADEQAVGAQVYAYTVRPQNVLDMSFDDQGKLNWILIRETVRDDKNPITASGKVTEQFRLWTRTYSQVFREQQRGKKIEIVMGPEMPHDLKRVPAIPVDHVLGENTYTSPGLINDIAYLDRACANYLSNLDAIIQDQTFSQLAMPAQGIHPGDEKYDALLEMGTKRIFTYDGEGGVKPEYLSPDPKQAGVILQVIQRIIGEIYHTIGMAGERTKQDNAAGIDNSSGVAKAYDFERMNSLLAAKAHSLENAENAIIDMVLAYHSQKAPEKELVKYPDNFDVRSLFDEFAVAEQLMLVDAPKEMRRNQMSQVIEKLFPRIAEDLRKKMIVELKDWLTEPSPAELVAGARPKPNLGRGKPNLGNTDRQGEVTATTP